MQDANRPWVVSPPDRIPSYLLTAGRSRPAIELTVESLLAPDPTGPHGNRLFGNPGHDQALQICRQAAPRATALAEVVGLLKRSAQVVKVIVGDLVAAGDLILLTTAPTASDGRGPTNLPNRETLERVLAGLQNL